MPDIKMQKIMRIPTYWIGGLVVLLLTAAYSMPSMAQVAAPSDPPALVQPENQALIIDTTTAVTMEWRTVARAATYEAQVHFTASVDGVEPIPLKTKVLSDTTREVLLTDLLDALTLPQSDGDSTFHWRVRARNANGEGPWSEVHAFRIVSLPIIDPIDPQTIDEEQTLTVQVNATNPNGGGLTYSLDQASLDAGMTIDAAGQISFTPTEAQGPGSFEPEVTVATPDGLTASTTFTITVNEVNLAPVLDAIGDQMGVVDQALAFIATATDDDIPANNLTYTLDQGALDQGMTIDPETGAFAWTPASVGTFSVTVTVTDDGTPPLADSETFSIVVTPATCPMLADIGEQTVDEENELSFEISASNECPSGVFAFGLDETSLGLGMTLTPLTDSTATFNWTPSEAQGPGAYVVTASVSDGDSTNTQDFTITVNEINLAPVLDAIGNRMGVVDQALTFIATATDDDIPANNLTYTLDQAALDLGMAIDPATGAFAWTPADVGAFSATVTVTDDGVPTLADSETISIVIDPMTCPMIAPIDNKSVDEETELSFVISASNECPFGVFAFGLDETSLGLGMTLTPLTDTTATFSWTPSEAQGPGSYVVTASVTDGDSTNTLDFTIDVNEVNLPPVIEAIADTTVDASTILALQVAASDPDLPENTLTYALDEASSALGMTIDGDGLFSWDIGEEQAGLTFTVLVTVSDRPEGDPDQLAAQASFDIVVNTITEPPPPPVPTDPPPVCTVAADLSLIWDSAPADSFSVQIDTDPNFPNPQIFTTSVTSLDLSLAGLEIGTPYYWRVFTFLNGLRSDPSKTVVFKRWPTEITVQHTLIFTKATEAGDFRMVSVPGVSTLAVSSTFSGTQAPSGPLMSGGDWDWSVWKDDAGTEPYAEYLNQVPADTRFEPGVGLWAISTSAWMVPATTVAPVSLVGDSTFALDLNQAPDQSQWTMIGNPFDFSVTWQDILNANPGATGALMDWTGQGYVERTVLEPYKGYYFFNQDNRPQLNIPCYLAPATGTVSAREEAPPIAALRLSLYGDREGSEPALSDVTVSWYEEAETGFDRFDRYVPPAYFEKHRISLFNEDLGTDYAYLSREARPSLDDLQVFHLELKAIPKKPTYLRIEGLQELAGREVYLLDETLGRSIDLQENPVVMLQPDREISALRLVIGDVDFIVEEAAKLLPEGFKLQQSYPNPFVDQTTIEYALPDPEFVSLEIYNVLGQRVRTLLLGEQDAGYHRVQWNGDSDAGEPVADGIYLYVFKSASYRATGRMVRVR